MDFHESSYDLTDITKAPGPSEAGPDDEVGAPAFLRIRHLTSQHRPEAGSVHARSRQHPMLLQEPWRGDHGHGVAAAFGTSFEQERDIQHHQTFAQGSGMGEEAFLITPYKGMEQGL